jgi:uncharacterized protein
MQSLEVILKVAERCNINCTYCYFFNSPDQSYKTHSKTVSEDTIFDLIKFLNEGVTELNIKYLSIDLHGGEPLILPKKKLKRICKLLKDNLHVKNLELRLQTNAMLVDAGWISIFHEFDIKVSSSLDGSKELHDKYRIDFKGKGTYDATVIGIKKLQEAAKDGLINSPGVICVVNPELNAKEVFNLFVNDLGFSVLEFLLPDFTYNSKEKNFSSEAYGLFLSELYKIWFSNDNPNIQIRVLNSVTSLILGGKSLVAGYGTIIPNVITISSNGHIGPDDTIRVCGEDYIDYSTTINTSKLSTYFNSEKYIAYKKAISEISPTCLNCCWYKLCGGGHPVHRFRDGKFNNATIYCEGLKMFYATASSEMIKKGMPLKTLTDILIEN